MMTKIGFLLPALPATAPIVDDLTRRVTGAWRARRTSEHAYRGVHTCTAGDGATSDNRDHWIYISGVGEVLTNSLLVHYVACHRHEMPAEELAALEVLTCDPVDPTPEELHGAPDGGGIGAVLAAAEGHGPVRTVQVDGTTFYAVGPSGWCRSEQEARGRAADITRGVSHYEAGNDIPSTVEMRFALHLAKSHSQADIPALKSALAGGVLSTAWLRAIPAVIRALDVADQQGLAWPEPEQRGHWPHEA